MLNKYGGYKMKTLTLTGVNSSDKYSPFFLFLNSFLKEETFNIL